MPDACRRQPPRARRLSILTCAAAALPVAVLLLLYASRPLKLGFYADDWLVLLHPQPGSWSALSSLLSQFQNRPLTAVVGWLAQIVIGWNPVHAQVLNVVLLAISAIAVGTLTYTLAGSLTDCDRARLWGSGTAAAFYLAFPWTLGFSTWATATISVAPATFLFCLAVCLLIRPGGERLSTQMFACLPMGASFLLYEAFYGQFMFLLALAEVMRPGRRSSWTILRPAVLLGIVNVACFIYNRSTDGVRKSFTADWPELFLSGYFHRFWPIMLMSFREVAPIIVGGLVLAGGIGLLLLARTMGRGRAALAILAMVAGIWAAGLLYAMAGYLLSTVGLAARATVVLSLYGALLAGLMGAAAAHQRRVGGAARGLWNCFIVSPCRLGAAVDTADRRLAPIPARRAGQSRAWLAVCRAARQSRHPDCRFAMGASGRDRLCDIS